MNGASHKDVDSDELPAHLRNQEAADYAAALYDAVTEALQRSRADRAPNDDRSESPSRCFFSRCGRSRTLFANHHLIVEKFCHLGNSELLQWMEVPRRVQFPLIVDAQRNLSLRRADWC